MKAVLILAFAGRFCYIPAIVKFFDDGKSMIKLNSKKIAEIVGSPMVVVDADIDEVVTDSRVAKRGDLFIAIKGEKFDGHDFVKDVISRGVEVVVVQKQLPDVPAVRQIVVPDTLIAYGKIGRYVRQQFKGKVIALTGSAGKTTTKEELKFALSQFAPTYATGGNHNNFVGVPETLCKLDMNAAYAVIEMGMSAKGEIARLVSFTEPDIAVVTNVYPMHIEFFDSFEGIAEAKAEIFGGLPKDGGTAVINADTNFADILEKRAAGHGAKIVKFGRDFHPDVRLELPEEGEHHLYNAWCVLSVIAELGLDVNRAAAALKNFGALDGRGKKHLLHTAAGAEYTLIDDSYSGQPEAMKLAIKSLSGMKCCGRRIAVLGKMAELGAHSQEKHIEIGRVLAESRVDVVVGVKPETQDMLAQLPERIERHYFENKDGLDEFLLNKLLQNNDIVLIKGARYSSELYKVTESLIKHG